MSYVFFVDFLPEADPRNPRRVRSTLYGPDMFSPREERMDMSWFAMPEGPGDPEAHLQPVSPTAPRGRIETLTVEMVPEPGPGQEEAEPVEVPVKVWLPPGYDDSDAQYPVVFVHGKHAIDEGHWDRSLDHLVGKSVEPLLGVFVEAPGNLWLVYDDHLIDKVVPMIEERYRVLPGRDARASIGVGWWSVNALTLAFGHAETFGRLGVQSVMMLETETAMFREALADTTAADFPYRIYLDWGEWDFRAELEGWDTRDSARESWELFEDRGWRPSGGKVYDSTDWISWSSRTDELLEALFPLTPPG